MSYSENIYIRGLFDEEESSIDYFICFKCGKSIKSAYFRSDGHHYHRRCSENVYEDELIEVYLF